MTNANHNRRNTRLRIETLESRQLMAGDLASDGTWTIIGTQGNDEIYIARDTLDTRYFVAEVNGRIVSDVLATSVRKTAVDGLAGNDHIEIDESTGVVAVSTLLRGGAGNDVIKGGASGDTIYGDSGNDRLIGGAGNDQLFGGDGDDYLEGGPGNDRLDGGLGKNQLVDDSLVNPPTQTSKNRVPAEWERHDSTWMQWPKGEEISSRENFAGIIRALQGYEKVNLVVESARAQTEAMNFLEARNVPLQNLKFQIMPYDWSWMRDNGAIWVEKTDAQGSKLLAVQDWGFDGWGGDGGPSRKDDAVPQYVARIKSATYEKVDVVLEKGTLEFNGKDTLLTSWTVLHARNPSLSKAQLEVVFKERFGVSKVVWVTGSAADDLTDGHIDGIARFVNETTVVVGRYANQSDPNAGMYEQAAATIRAAGLNVVRMDIPGNITYRGVSLPANYLNYLVANGVVVASSYGNTAFDNAARLQLQQLFPGRAVVMTDTRELWYNGGAVHCVTNDQPILNGVKTTSNSSTIVNANPKMPAAPLSTLAPMAVNESVSNGALNRQTSFAKEDVNGDGVVSSLDVLMVINALSRQSKLAAVSTLHTSATAVRDSIFANFDSQDVNGDGELSPIDVLLILNRLNKVSTGV